jgi:hypothetical protein
LMRHHSFWKQTFLLSLKLVVTSNVTITIANFSKFMFWRRFKKP